MQDKIFKVIVDRPLGSRHPKFAEMIYPVNYGYIEGIFAKDGEEQDAYILGEDLPVTEFEGHLVAIIHRKNDVEDKWVIAPETFSFTVEDIRQATDFQEKYFDTEIILTKGQAAGKKS